MKKGRRFYNGAVMGFTATVAILLVAGVAADDSRYVGTKKGKCKMCHAKLFKSWQKTKHATAFDKLTNDEKKDPKVLKRTTIGYGAPTGFKSVKDTPNLVNVGCEACHGPGGKHIDVPLSDKEAKKASILNPKKKNVCAGCHEQHEITDEMEKMATKPVSSPTACLQCHDPHGEMKKAG